MGDSSQIGASADAGAGYSNSTVASDRPAGPAMTAGGSGSTGATGGNGVAMGLTGVGGAVEAYSRMKAGRYNRSVARNNARLARVQADQAEQAGHFAADRVAEQERITAGSNDAAAAAGNTVVGAGTNRFVRASNEAQSDMDRVMIETNARREAYGFRVRAASDIASGNLANQTGMMGAAGTLLETGSKEWLEADPNHGGYSGRGLTFS